MLCLLSVKAGFLPVILAVLEFVMQTKLVSDSSVYLPPRYWDKGMHHHHYPANQFPYGAASYMLSGF